MRLKLTALGLGLPVAALLSGCGTGTLGSSTASAVGATKAIHGKAFGGQQPDAGAQIALYAFGTGGYGSKPTLLAQTISDSGGYFNIDPTTIQCPTADTPVYLLALGGDPGFGTNSAISLGSSAGRCADAASAFVTINEVSTAMLAYTYAHYYSKGASDGITSDYFGAPAGQTQTLINTYTGTVFHLVDVENGYPRKNTSTVTFEGAKLITMGNILGACVNSAGPGSPSCKALFGAAPNADGSAPSNTLEAALNIALNPTQNVAFLYALQPQSGAAAFTGGLTVAPADWTLSASYTSPTFALGVNSRTTSTIDIDTAGRVWFPSNGPGAVGVGYFDPTSGSFSPLFTGNLQHPQQVAIDIDGYVWANDTGSSNIAGFPGSNPSSPLLFSLPNTNSTSVTVAYDNTIRYGIVAPDGLPALAAVTSKSSYAEVPNTEIPGGGGFIASSLAADVVGGFGIGGQELSTPTTYDLYGSPNGGFSFITYQTFQDAGQVVFTGNNFVGTRGGYSNGADGICIWASQGCFGMANSTNIYRHPSGLSIDGASTLWLADQNGNTIEEIPSSNGSYLNGSNLANNTILTHNTDNGGTTIRPTGVAVDNAGNVWVSNYGCYGDGCTPTNFVLAQIIGAAAPTITPVSRQVVIDDLVGTKPSKQGASAPTK